jgi:hypothetical protein
MEYHKLLIVVKELALLLEWLLGIIHKLLLLLLKMPIFYHLIIVKYLKDHRESFLLWKGRTLEKKWKG